jgi:transketolase
MVATGAELWPVLDAAAQLKKEGITVRVVSMPSWRLFEEQSAEYQASVFPDHLPKLAVEAGSPLGWWKYVGRHGDVIGMERFGASAKGEVALRELGFSAANIVSRGKALLERAQKEHAAMAGK